MGDIENNTNNALPPEIVDSDSDDDLLNLDFLDLDQG